MRNLLVNGKRSTTNLAIEQQTTKRDRVAALRALVRHPKGSPHGEGTATVHPLGHAALDEALDGGLRLGALHEFCGPAALTWVLALAFAQPGPVFWCGEAVKGGYPALPNPYALAQRGYAPGRFYLLAPESRADRLWAARECLALPGGAAVILLLDAPLDLRLAQRLQWAAEPGGALGLAVAPSFARKQEASLVPSAHSRWHVAAKPPSWPQPPSLALRLLKNRHGPLLSGDIAYDPYDRSLFSHSGF